MKPRRAAVTLDPHVHTIFPDKSIPDVSNIAAAFDSEIKVKLLRQKFSPMYIDCAWQKPLGTPG